MRVRLPLNRLSNTRHWKWEPLKRTVSMELRHLWPDGDGLGCEFYTKQHWTARSFREWRKLHLLAAAQKVCAVGRDEARIRALRGGAQGLPAKATKLAVPPCVILSVGR